MVCGWMGGVWVGFWGSKFGDGWLMLSLHAVTNVQFSFQL